MPGSVRLLFGVNINAEVFVPDLQIHVTTAYLQALAAIIFILLSMLTTFSSFPDHSELTVHSSQAAATAIDCWMVLIRRYSRRGSLYC